MYAHQVIEDLEKILLQRAIASSMYRENTNFVIKNLKSAKQFFLGEFEDFKKPLETTLTDNTQLFLNESSSYTRLPYKTCWFEFLNNMVDVKPEEEVPKRGLLAIEIKPDLIWVWVVNYVKLMATWVLSPQAYYISVGKVLSDNDMFLSMAQKMNPSFLQNPNNKENIKKSNIFPMPLSETINTENSSELAQDDTRDMYVLNSVLLLLNCKNIITEENNPPERLNKKRRTRGKQELFAYKTLCLKLPAKKNMKTNVAKSSGSEPKRIHLCRGHFKIYTKNNPLFGKYTGVYWWQPQLRGDKTLGLVEKDYEIKSIE